MLSMGETYTNFVICYILYFYFSISVFTTSISVNRFMNHNHKTLGCNRKIYLKSA